MHYSGFSEYSYCSRHTAVDAHAPLNPHACSLPSTLPTWPSSTLPRGRPTHSDTYGLLHGAFNISDYSVEGMTADEEQVGKYLEEGGHNPIEVLSQSLLAVSENSRKNLSRQPVSGRDINQAPHKYTCRPRVTATPHLLGACMEVLIQVF